MTATDCMPPGPILETQVSLFPPSFFLPFCLRREQSGGEEGGKGRIPNSLSFRSPAAAEERKRLEKSCAQDLWGERRTDRRPILLAVVDVKQCKNVRSDPSPHDITPLPPPPLYLFLLDHLRRQFAASFPYPLRSKRRRRALLEAFSLEGGRRKRRELGKGI